MSLFFRTMGDGHPLIILHGLFGSSDNWLTVAKSLATSYQVILPDQRNHGRSFHSETFNYLSMAGDLAALLKKGSIENPIVMGHSMGGKTAMMLATQIDISIKKLVVVDIGPKAYPVHHDAILKGLNAIPLEGIGSRQQADDLLGNYVEETGIRQFLLKNLARKEGGGFEWKINLPVITDKIDNVGQALPAGSVFNNPTLFINGSKSDYLIEADKLLIREIFPKCQFRTIAGAGHWVHAEKPVEFLREITEFLSS